MQVAFNNYFEVSGCAVLITADGVVRSVKISPKGMWQQGACNS